MPLPDDRPRAGDLSSAAHLGIFVATFAAVLVIFLAGTVLQLINLPFGLVATSLLVFAAFGLLMPWAFGQKPAAFAGLRRVAPGLVFLGLALGLANMGFANFVMGALRELLPGSWSRMADETSIVLVRASPAARLVIVLAAGVVAPFGEELFFRGWLQGVLARRFSMATSIVLTAVVFSATHVDPVGFVARVELGILFGLLREKTGSLYPSMAAHAAHNLISTAVLYTTPDPLAELNEPFRWGHSALIAAGSLAVVVGLVFLFLRLTSRSTAATRPGPLEARGPRLFGAFALVAAMLVGAGVLLQVAHRRLPGYGLVQDPIDRILEQRARARMKLPPPDSNEP